MLPIVVADRANGLSLFLNNTQHPYTCRNPYVGLQSPLRSRAPLLLFTVFAVSQPFPIPKRPEIRPNTIGWAVHFPARKAYRVK